MDFPAKSPALGIFNLMNRAGGVYNVLITFPESYPKRPPKVLFTPVIQHPNVYSSGDVCLSILDSSGWKPSLSVKQVLLGLQELLDNPNPQSPANTVSNKVFPATSVCLDLQKRQQDAMD